jgi:NAD+ synthase (glutamine-hydrolysing)
VKHFSKRLSQDERIYQALVLGTRDYTRKNGFRKVVLGLSGGIDSSLVAAIAVDALGKENVIGVTMPSRYTSRATKADAGILAKNLGIQFIEASIEKIFKVYLTELKGLWKGTRTGLAEENLQARIRGNILMALSNKFGWLVLTTGNKSEVAVGYCTLYGDMTGGFAVIKDVPKTKVYDLARLKNRQQGKIIPVSVLKRAPTAELKANQKDQDSLPPYDVLDETLKEYIENHWPAAKMARRRDRKLIKKITEMVDCSEYKRRQAPPGIKITPRAFGKDWRLPITNRYKER